MKKMLIVLAALTVMGAGFATAEEQKTETKEPSTAYMHGYNKATSGNDNNCGYVYGGSENKEKNIYDCNQGYVQGKRDWKEINNQSNDD